MKLRIKGNSFRLRVTRSEVAQLVSTGSIEETIFFSTEESSRLTYALQYDEAVTTTKLIHSPEAVTLVLPRALALTWAEGSDTGVYESIDLGNRGVLTVVVEKDFACLDLSDAENADTFPNPNAGASC